MGWKYYSKPQSAIDRSFYVNYNHIQEMLNELHFFVLSD